MKNDNTAIVAAVAVAALGWWYSQRSRGLTITGAPINPMIDPRLGVGQRGVQGSIAATNVGATPQTNVFSIIGQATALLTNLIPKGAGNTPAMGSQPITRPANQNTIPAAVSGAPSSASWVDAIAVPGANNPAPYLAYTDPTSKIYWPPLATAPDYIAPNTGVPLLGWTVPQGFGDIPPPPGSGGGISITGLS